MTHRRASHHSGHGESGNHSEEDAKHANAVEKLTPAELLIAEAMVRLATYDPKRGNETSHPSIHCHWGKPEGVMPRMFGWEADREGAYLPNSPLVESVAFKQGGATRLTTTKTYDNLNRLSAISNQLSALGTQLSHAYSYNNANQRTRATREDNARWDYGYDALGQVTSAAKSKANGTPVLGHAFAYTFDDIGNRKTATSNGLVSSYTANLLNQYDEHTVPNGRIARHRRCGCHHHRQRHSGVAPGFTVL
jgi:YD repeat-containing protein